MEPRGPAVSWGLGHCNRPTTGKWARSTTLPPCHPNPSAHANREHDSIARASRQRHQRRVAHQGLLTNGISAEYFEKEKGAWQILRKKDRTERRHIRNRP